MLIRFLMVVSLFLLLIGCGKSKYPIIPVEGKVIGDNNLPAGTKLLFTPAEGGMQTASATLDAAGYFTVKHLSGKSGAELGKYIVTVRAPDGMKSGFYDVMVTKKYYDEGVAIEVKAGMGELVLRIDVGKQP